MTRDLESQYRRLLRWYPRSWRDANGDALIGAALDAAEHEHRSSIPRSERVGFVAAGLQARARLIVMQPVRDAAATAALSMGAGGTMVLFLVSSWAPGDVDPAFGDAPRPFGPFFDLGPLLALLWAAALAAGLAGRWPLGRIALLLAAACSLLMPSIADAIGSPTASWDPATLSYLTATALLAASGTPRTRVPLALATIGTALIAWVALGCTTVRLPTLVVWYQADLAWYGIASAVVVVLLLVLARLWTAAFILLLSTVPAIIALDAAALRGTPHGTGNPWILTAPVAVGLAALVLASHHALELPTWQRHRSADEREPLL